jgi:hypothetical protein
MKGKDVLLCIPDLFTYKVRPKSFETSCFKRVLCVISSGRHQNFIVLCSMYHVTSLQRFSFSGLWVRTCFVSEDFLSCHRLRGGAESCLLPGSSFNGTRRKFLEKKISLPMTKHGVSPLIRPPNDRVQSGWGKTLQNQRECYLKNREWRRC